VSSTTYSAGQVVYCQAAGACLAADQGSTYEYINGSSSSGHDPSSTTYWQQITAAGADGAAGATGATGGGGMVWTTSLSVAPFTTTASLYLTPGIHNDISGCDDAATSSCPVNIGVYGNVSATVYGACTADSLQLRNYTNNSPIQMTVTLYHAVAASPTVVLPRL